LSLIVIGVLLALSVDEWRHSRARDRAAEAAIQSIRAELVANRELAQTAMEYHQDRIGHIRQALESGTPLQPGDFPRGFTNPARFLGAAWDTARESGDLTAVDRDLHRTIAGAHATQARYEKQAEIVSQIIYQQLHAEGTAGVVKNPQSLMTLLYTFLYREQEIIDVFDQTLAAIDGS
jgi:hypothetical protein